MRLILVLLLLSMSISALAERRLSIDRINHINRESARIDRINKYLYRDKILYGGKVSQGNSYLIGKTYLLNYYPLIYNARNIRVRRYND